MWNSIIGAVPILKSLISSGPVKDRYHHAQPADGGVWHHAFQLAKVAVEDMTIAEKVRLMSG